MDITPPVPRGGKIIQRYGGGGFIISDNEYFGSIIIIGDRVISWPISKGRDISFQSLKQIQQSDVTIDLLIIGCGVEMFAMPDDLNTRLYSSGIAIEPMETGAACRTWNVLLAEGRRAGAALISID